MIRISTSVRALFLICFIFVSSPLLCSCSILKCHHYPSNTLRPAGKLSTRPKDKPARQGIENERISQSTSKPDRPLKSMCAFNPSIHHQIPSRIPLINHLISCFVPSLHPIESLIEKLLFIPLSNHHIPMKGQSSICQPCQVNNKERQYREEMNHYSSSPCHAAEM